MSFHPNGVATLPSAHRKIVLKADTITYTFERPDGETVSLAGYKKGPGCPIPILIAVDEAIASMRENEPTDEETGTAGDPFASPPIPPTPGTLSPRRYLAKLNYAERTGRREMLQAVIPGLGVEDANLLGADGGPWKEILIELGWRETDEAMAARILEADADPEALGEASPSTGPTASPDSASATRATTP